MKLSMKAHKLANADVTYLSLVERGANRAPFKIQKTEKPMFNLDRSLSRIMKGDDKPAIVGYVIDKTDKLPEIEKALKDAGVKVDAVVEQGDVLVLKQGDHDLKALSNVAIKLSPDFMVVCKGFDPKGLSAASFGEVLKTQGYMPGPELATEALYSAVAEAMSSDGAVAKIDDAVDEFHGYITSLCNSVPLPAFKAFDAFRAAKYELSRKAMTKPEDVPQEKWDAMDDSARAAACKAYKEEQERLAKKADDDAKAAKKAEDDAAAAAAKVEDDKKKVGENPKPDPAKPDPAKPDPKPEPALSVQQITEIVGTAIKAATTDILKQVTESGKKTQETLTGLATQVSAVAKDAKEAKALAVKNEAALKGTVLSPDTTGDPDGDGKPPARKTDGEIGAFDTAYHRNIRKADRAKEAAKRSHML
jgi:hypothetical protein